jgi:hypothetical protein
MRKVTCMCEASFEADLPETVDLDEKGEALVEILSGDFFALTCPSCGNRLKPELRVRIISKKRGLDAMVLPEAERSSLYMGTAGIPAGVEVIVGYAELYERAKILEDGLDPEVIEIIKLWLVEKAEEQSPEAVISVAYAGKKDGKLVFHLSGLKEGQIAVLPIDSSTYDKTLADKARSKSKSPFDRVFKGPYRSIRILEIDEDE